MSVITASQHVQNYISCGCILLNMEHVCFREWMGKVERVRPRPADGQEGWKEGAEDRGGSKTSWTDSADPRAPSPGSMSQFNKSAAPQDFQVQPGGHDTALPTVAVLFPLTAG